MCMSASEFIDPDGVKPLIVPQVNGLINRKVIKNFYDLFIDKVKAHWDSKN